MFDSKKIFYIVFAFVIIVEIAVLGIVLGSYFSNSNKVLENTQNQRKIIAIIYRNTNIEYLSKKFRLIIEDAFLVMKTYENVVEWGLTFNENTSNSSNISTSTNTYLYSYEIQSEEVLPGAALTLEEHNIGWYVGDSPDTRLKGMYIYKKNSTLNNTSLKYLKNSLITQQIITKQFKKYFDWKNKIYVNVEFIYFTFSKNGFFYKYPLVYSKSAFDTETNNNECLNVPNKEDTGYEPRCRPFFTSAKSNTNSLITITAPYKFQSGTYGNDICIKSHSNTTSTTPETTPETFEYLLCYAFNFYDYYIFKSQISNILLSTSTQIYLLYIDKTTSPFDLKVVFNSEYYPTDLSCNVEPDSVKYPNYNCEPINYFDVLNKEKLDELYTSLSKTLSGDELNQAYVEEYLKVQKEFNETIYDNIINIATKNPRELISIDLENVNDARYDDNFLFRTNNNLELDETTSPSTLKYVKSEYEETFYMFPLIGGFDYNYTTDKGYELYEVTKEGSYNYYIITVESGEVINNSTHNFKIVVVIEIVLFFIYLFFLDTLIWFIFGVFYYYFYHGILLPLKQMVKLYINIGRITAISQSKVDTDKKYSKAFASFQVLKAFTHPSKKKKVTSETCFSKISNFKEWISDVINNIFKMSEYPDISDALTSLQAINLILQFNSTELTGVHITRTEPYSKMNTFTDALEYLMERFYKSESSVDTLQFPILKLIIEKMFISVLKDTKNTIEDIEEFYRKITTAVRRKRNEMKVYSREFTNMNEKQKNDTSMEIINKLENNLVYYFYTYKALQIENEKSELESNEENIILNHFDPDEEEKICLKTIKQKEDMYLRNPNKKFKRKNTMNIKNNDNKDNEIKLNYDYVDENEEAEILKLTTTLEDYLTKNTITSILNNSTFNKVDLFSNYYGTMNEKKIYRNKRIAKMIKILKNISVKCILSSLYIRTSENQRGLVIYEEIFSEMKQFEKYVLKESNLYHSSARKKSEISNYQGDKEELMKLSKWKFTSFALLTCEVLFFERILFLLTLIQKKYGQNKNELFIFLNILDLGPIYTVKIKKSIINKLTIFVKNNQRLILYTNGLGGTDISLSAISNLLNTNNDYIDIQRALYKLITLRNITIKTTKKKILFVFDLDNKFLKDKIFKEILLHHFTKNNKISEFQFYYSYFTKKLHILTNKNFDNIEINDTKFVKKYLKNIPLGEIESSFCGDTQGEKREKTISDFFFDLLSKEYILKYKKRTSVLFKPREVHRADKALYHAAVFGINEDEKKMSVLEIPKQSQVVNHYNKYLIMFVNVNSIFTDNKKNWEEIAKIVYEQKFTLIIIVSTNDDINNEDFNRKINNYKKLVNSYIIDGHLFIMKNFEMLKIILNSVFPIRFSEFNTDIIYHFLESIKLIYNSGD